MNIFNKIHKLYNETDYYKLYSGDILKTTLMIITFFLTLSILLYFRFASTIKLNWKENKCKPQYMFFSGWIKKREEDHPLCVDRTGNRRPCNSFESTIINFSDCLEGYIKVIVEGTIKPLADNLDLKKVLMKDMMGSAQGIAKLTQRFADSTMGALTTMMTTLNGLIGPSMSSDETQGSRTGGGGGAMFQAQIVLKHMFLQLGTIFPIITNFIIIILFNIQAFLVAAYGAFNGLLLLLFPVIYIFTVIGVLLIIAGWSFAWAGVGAVLIVLGVIFVLIAIFFFAIFLMVAISALLYNTFLTALFGVNQVTISPPPQPFKPTRRRRGRRRRRGGGGRRRRRRRRRR